MSRPRPERRLLVALVAFGFLALACGGPDRTQGVAVRSIGTDIGLGIEPEDAGPANIIVRRAARPPRPNPRTPDRFTIDPVGTPVPVIKRCPAAGPFDFPKEEAGIEPNGVPAEGVLSWKYEGSVKTDGGTFPIDAIVPRIVSGVTLDPNLEGAFRYTITDFRFFDDRARSGGSLSTRYLVVPSSPGDTDATSRDEGEGMYITSMTFRTVEEGEIVEQQFNWVPPVKIFAFPAVPGTEIDSTGVNPDGSRLTVVGRIEKKEQLDACGERIDSWLVDAEMIFDVTDPDTLQRETFEAGYDYNVALQFGSLLVGERINSPRDDPILKIRARVGQVPKHGNPDEADVGPT